MLNYEYPPLGGGAAPVCRQLCELFARRGHQVDVVTMGFRGLPRRETLNGVHVTRVPALRKRQATCETHEMLSYVLSALPRVVWRLGTRNYDVIHLHFVIPTGLLAWLATRIKPTPYVITAHGSDIPGYNPDRFNKEHTRTAPLLRRIMNGAAALTAPSKYLRGLMEKACGPYEIDYIPNGLFIDQLTPQPKEDILLMTGRLLRRKGFHVVLEALRGVETDYEVHIVGDGPEREALERLAEAIPAKVVFHGWLDNGSPDLKALYERARIFCLPSQRENASISLLEAMLAGAAVITSNVSGCPETVGEAGLVVPPDDPEALREVLLPLLASPDQCAAWGAQARERVRAQFDWEKIADRYLALLEQVARTG